MTYSEFRNRLLALSPESECLKFISDRIKQNNYRGRHVSQHNRYDFDQACDILYELKCVAKDKKIKIRTRDLSKHPQDMEGTEKYCLFCNTLTTKYNKYTQDTVRKNFFVDFARMGLINRYDKKGELIPLTKKVCCQYVALTERGKILANKKESRKNKYIAFSKGLDMMTSNLVLDMFNLSDKTDRKITRMEYTYFVSYLGESIISTNENTIENNYVSEEKVVALIKDYRSLRDKHNAIDQLIYEYCSPDNFDGDKTKKRDIKNWINETEQIFKLLANTVYFEFLDKYNTLKLRVDRRMNIDGEQRLTRSTEEKNRYFINHGIDKCETKTLHHIVPLDLWEDWEDFKLLDDWRNMIYIESYNHEYIHSLSTRYMKLSICDESFVLSDFDDNNINFTNNNEVIFSKDNSSIMTVYNKELLLDRKL